MTHKKDTEHGYAQGSEWDNKDPRKKPFEAGVPMDRIWQIRRARLEGGLEAASAVELQAERTREKGSMVDQMVASVLDVMAVSLRSLAYHAKVDGDHRDNYERLRNKYDAQSQLLKETQEYVEQLKAVPPIPEGVQVKPEEALGPSGPTAQE